MQKIGVRGMSGPRRRRCTGHPVPTAASPVLRTPFEEQDGGIVPQLVALVFEDGVDEQSQHLCRALSGGGGADDEVSEPVKAELRTVRVASFHDAVGVEQDESPGSRVASWTCRAAGASGPARPIGGCGRLSSARATTRSARISSGGG